MKYPNEVRDRARDLHGRGFSIRGIEDYGTFVL